MKALRELTRAELARARDKARAVASAITDEFIDAGRGHERPSDTIKRDDPLSLRWRAASEHEQELAAEYERRMTYHGSAHRTRNPTGARAMSTPSPKQLAQRERFAAMARAGRFKRKAGAKRRHANPRGPGAEFFAKVPRDKNHKRDAWVAGKTANGGWVTVPDFADAKPLSASEAAVFKSYCDRVRQPCQVLPLTHNPKARAAKSKGVRRTSQITGKAPTKRLVKRRKITAELVDEGVEGVFANPSDYFNIERSGFRLDTWVGYAGGAVWSITKSAPGYLAIPRQADAPEAVRSMRLRARTLRELSDQLAALDAPKANPKGRTVTHVETRGPARGGVNLFHLVNRETPGAKAWRIPAAIARKPDFQAWARGMNYVCSCTMAQLKSKVGRFQ